jgi:hypothetical protein
MPTTAWSGFYGDGIGSNSSYSILVNKNPRRNGIRRTMNREGFRAITELFDTLLGAAAGDTAAATHSRVAAPADVSIGAAGGTRTIDTITDINRASTAADITALKELTFGVTTRPTYPRDLSGNGGGAY